jgi:hypothetical protein
MLPTAAVAAFWPFLSQNGKDRIVGLADRGCPLFVRVLLQTGPNPRMGQMQKSQCLLG